MSLIDISFFTKLINVPNSGNSEIAETLNSYVAQYEPEFLEKVLGYSLFKAYKDNSASQRFVDIITGKEFTDLNGNLNKWNGLVKTIVPASTNPDIAAQKQSIIANYVYYNYRKENITQYTGLGEKIFSSEEVSTVSPRRRLVIVWNEISKEVNQLIQFLDANQAVYPEWTYIDRVSALKYFGYVNPIF
jgi:hypothetical protein